MKDLFENLRTRLVSSFVMIAISLFGLFLLPDVFIAFIGVFSLYELNSGFNKEMWPLFAVYSICVFFGVLSFWGILNAFGGSYIVLLITIVCCTDSFAYLVGKTVGGPKLCEKISPSKTVSGLCGGVACGFIFGVIAMKLLDINEFSRVYVFCICLLAALGDLAESYTKRCAGVKDFLEFIPGHGGLLDRIDSFIFSSIVMYLLLM